MHQTVSQNNEHSTPTFETLLQTPFYVQSKVDSNNVQVQVI